MTAHAAAGRTWRRWAAPAPTTTLAWFRLPVWGVTAVVGSLSGILLTGTLAAATGHAPLQAAGFAVGAATAGALGALALVLARHAWRGTGGYTFYHHQLAALAASSAFLALTGQPLLSNLDLVAVGTATAVAIGRFGCLAAGCCHGRPHGWGVCYRQAHVAAGFPRYLAGVRLFPVQALESLWAVFIVLVGSAMVLRGAPPGSVLAWYLVVYGVGRFVFEFLRGDAARPYMRGVSEAQWTSLLAVGCAAAAEWAGLLPFQIWHTVAFGNLLAAVVGLAWGRRPGGWASYPTHELLSARHIQEVARALAAAKAVATENPDGRVQLAHTSLGIRLSASARDSGRGPGLHLALSARHGLLSDAAAGSLSRLIVQLQPAVGEWQLLRSDQGVFHLLLTENAHPLKQPTSTPLSTIWLEKHID